MNADSLNQSQAIALYHPILHAIAYKMLGSLADAEDIVQDTFLKWLTIDQEKINNTKAYLIKAVTNNCINHLNALKEKKKEYLDSLNPGELIGRFKETDFINFDLESELSAALEVVHKKLAPMEKAIFLLREVFELEYEELQEIFDKKKENCRQLFCRANEKLSQETKKFKLNIPNHIQLLESFKNACTRGNLSEFINDLSRETKNNPSTSGI